MIEVKDLCKDFNKNKVLKGINVTINEGDVVCVIGPSGSGKSTFLRCLNLLEKPTSGHIIFEGDELLANSEKELNLHQTENGNGISAIPPVSAHERA